MYRITGLSALLAALVATPAFAQSDNNQSTSNVLSGGLIIPYDGYLMLDNAPLNGSSSLRFELWDHPTDTSANRRVWAEDQTVTFFNGRFSVGLGSGTQVSSRTIRDVVQDGEKLYLAILVQDGTGTLVPLSGRQAIEPVPYAAWSASSANFDVGGNLTVGGQITAGAPGNRVTVNNGTVNATGQVQAGSVTTGGQLQAGSVTTAGQVQAGSVSTGGQVQAASVTATGQVQAGSANVTGNLSVGQQISATGNLVTSSRLIVGGDQMRLGTSVNANGDGGVAMTKSTNDTLVINPAEDFHGGTTVDGNLTYTGQFRGWALLGPFRQDSNGNRLLTAVGRGFCFLTQFSTDHNQYDPGRMNCHVFVSNNNWYLGNQESGGNRGDTNCEARCIAF